jgi:hypothetical protein
MTKSPVSNRFLIAIVGVSLFSMTTTAHAASVYIDPAISELRWGDALTMAVRLDIDEINRECVNTVDITLSYPEGIEPDDVSIGNSILRIWVQEPTINRDERTISFAGGIPNGYCGRVAGDPRLTNVLAEVIMRAPVGVSSNEPLTVDFLDTTTLYLNDGFGSKAITKVYPAKITINETLSEEVQNDWNERVKADDVPPEEFSIELEKINGKYYIIFNTTDKQTGIDRYQVMEEPITQFGTFDWGRADAPWLEAKSPYPLKDQSLNSTIRVKAIDKAGNEYIAVLNPDQALRTLSQNQIYSYVAYVVVFGLLMVFLGTTLYLLRKRRQHMPVDREVTTDEK